MRLPCKIFMAIIILLSPAEALAARKGYKSCVRAVGAEHTVVANVLPLEGFTKTVSLRERSEGRSLTNLEAEDLIAAHPKIQACREAKLNEERANPAVVAAWRKIYTFYDDIYLDLLKNELSLGSGAGLLIKGYEVSDQEIDKLEDIKSAQDSASSAALFELSKKFLETPQVQQEPAAPRYRCWSDTFGNIYCDPR